jgi:hypothetical protein
MLLVFILSIGKMGVQAITLSHGGTVNKINTYLVLSTLKRGRDTRLTKLYNIENFYSLSIKP